MSVERFDLRTIAPQPWKNGAGVTREIACGGATPGHFDWRISFADIDRDAPFSAFPGVDRCIVLLRGAGMQLRSRDGGIDHRLTEPLVPFHFSGDAALDATLADGASRDLNVMTRRGMFRSDLRCLRDAAALPAAEITLLLCSAGAWAVEADAPHTLQPLQALLWRTPPARLAVRPLHADEPAALLQVRLCQDRGA